MDCITGKPYLFICSGIVFGSYYKLGVPLDKSVSKRGFIMLMLYRGVVRVLYQKGGDRGGVGWVG